MATRPRSTRRKIATTASVALQPALKNYDKVADQLRSSWSAVLEGGTIEDAERLELNRQRERTKTISSEIGAGRRRSGGRPAGAGHEGGLVRAACAPGLKAEVTINFSFIFAGDRLPPRD